MRAVFWSYVCVLTPTTNNKSVALKSWRRKENTETIRKRWPRKDGGCRFACGVDTGNLKVRENQSAVRSYCMSSAAGQPVEGVQARFEAKMH